MWAPSRPPQLPQKRGCPSPAAPSTKDVGGLVSLNGGFREGGRRGGSIKREAPVVSDKIQVEEEEGKDEREKDR